jgi:hypothetical protein
MHPCAPHIVTFSYAGPGRRPLALPMRAQPRAAPPARPSPLTGPQAGSSDATADAAGLPPDLLPLALHVLAAHRAAQRTGKPCTLRTRGSSGGAAPAGARKPAGKSGKGSGVVEGPGRWAGPVRFVDNVGGGGRGRGTVATRDVAPGELLLLEPALGVVYDSEVDPEADRESFWLPDGSPLKGRWPCVGN